MGYLIYGWGARYPMPDRTLSHLQIAVITSLRSRERFLINWVVKPQDGSGRVSLWVSPAIPLQFQFSGPRPTDINRTWVDAMQQSSHSGSGLLVMPEDEAEPFLAALQAGAGAPDTGARERKPASRRNAAPHPARQARQAQTASTAQAASGGVHRQSSVRRDPAAPSQRQLRRRQTGAGGSGEARSGETGTGRAAGPPAGEEPRPGT